MNYFKKILFFIMIAGLSFSNIQAKIPSKPHKEIVNISLSNIEIKKLIELYSKIEKKNILLPEQIIGKISFISSSPIYKSEIFDILLNVLDTKGYTLVQDGRFLKVVRVSDAIRNNLKVYKPKDYINPYGEMITKQIVLKNIPIDIVASKIRQFLSKTGRLVTIRGNNTILISDYPKNIETIQKIVTLIEKNREKAVDIFKIKHAKLGDIYSQAVEISKNVFNQSIPYDKIVILQNKELNSLMLIGLKQNIEKLKNELKKLDKVKVKKEEITKIITLKNADAKSAFTTLSQIIAKRKYKNSADKPNIAYSKEINAIILIGKLEAIEPLEKILKEFDKEKYQVYVQARIIEISDTKAKQIGIKYGLAGGGVSSSSLLTFSSDFGANAINLPSSIASSIINTNNISSNLAIGAAISFLQKNGASKTISNPSILCVNNIESSIYVGKNKSFLVGQTTNSNGTTVNYQREDIGLTLKVRPRVASNDKVTLQVSTILENVDKSDTTVNSDRPTTTKQEVKTQVIVTNGESIVIGGLLQNTSSTNTQKIPLLGDIPVLGGLFRHKETSFDKKSIVIILTPYIIAKSSSLEKMQQFLSIYGKVQENYNKKIFAKIEKKSKKNESKIQKNKDINFDNVVDNN